MKFKIGDVVTPNRDFPKAKVGDRMVIIKVWDQTGWVARNDANGLELFFLETSLNLFVDWLNTFKIAAPVLPHMRTYVDGEWEVTDFDECEPEQSEADRIWEALKGVSQP